MKNIIIETGIIARDVTAGLLLTMTLIAVIAMWIVLDIRL